MLIGRPDLRDLDDSTESSDALPLTEKAAVTQQRCSPSEEAFGVSSNRVNTGSSLGEKGAAVLIASLVAAAAADPCAP